MPVSSDSSKPSRSRRLLPRPNSRFDILSGGWGGRSFCACPPFRHLRCVSSGMRNVTPASPRPPALRHHVRHAPDSGPAPQIDQVACVRALSIEAHVAHTLARSPTNTVTLRFPRRRERCRHFCNASLWERRRSPTEPVTFETLTTPGGQSRLPVQDASIMRCVHASSTTPRIGLQTVAAYDLEI